MDKRFLGRNYNLSSNSASICNKFLLWFSPHQITLPSGDLYIARSLIAIDLFQQSPTDCQTCVYGGGGSVNNMANIYIYIYIYTYFPLPKL